VTNYVPMWEQAAVFNGEARVFAPRYRQLSQGAQETNQTADYEQAMDVAYSDVHAAFQEFLKHNKQRPFFIGSYSQGTLHSKRLLQDLQKHSPEVLKRLVVAYLIGNTVPEQEMLDAAKLAVCQNATEVGCYISYNTVLNGDKKGANHWKKKGKPTCVNPLSWRQDEALIPPSMHLGGVPILSAFLEQWPLVGHYFLEKPHAQLVSAQCQDGILFVSDPSESQEHGYKYSWNPGDAFHAYDLNLFYMNVRTNIRARIKAFVSQR